MVHGTKPEKVLIENDMLIEMQDTAELIKAVEGWYFDSNKNVTHITVKLQKVQSSFTVTLSKVSP